MFKFSLLLVPLSCISNLEQLMSLTPTPNQGGLMFIWKISGLISVVGYSYVQQFLWGRPLLIAGNYSVMRLIDNNMKN